MPLRWKLLGALPADQRDHRRGGQRAVGTGDALASTTSGIDVIVAVVVAFTISLELTVLLTKSILGPSTTCSRPPSASSGATSTARVPVTSGDELGALAGQLQRDARRPRRARGAARGVRQLRRSRGRRARARGGRAARGPGGRGHGAVRRRARLHAVRRALERARDRRLPQRLLRRWSCRSCSHHGGHANKFVGDGLLGVFGAPERRCPTTPTAALAAACEIARAVERALRRRRVGSASGSTPARSWWARSAAAGGSSSR